MKDGRTHLAYKAEHVIDLESDFLLSAEVYSADEADTQTLLPSVTAAQENLDQASADRDIEEVVADKGYHSADTLAQCHDWGVLGLRTYIPEPKRQSRWDWVKRPWEERVAVCANHRRVRGQRCKRLQRRRSDWRNGASLTCATRGEPGGPGYATCKRFASVTRSTRRRGTWVW